MVKIRNVETVEIRVPVVWIQRIVMSATSAMTRSGKEKIRSTDACRMGESVTQLSRLQVV